MNIKVVRTKDLPGYADRVAELEAEAACKDAMSACANDFCVKSFYDLTAEEKDKLLYLLAVQAGILKAELPPQ